MKRFKRLAALTIATGITGGALIGGTASAHTPTVTPSCSGLTYDFRYYEGDASNNLLTVVIDGVPTKWFFAFGTNGQINWSASHDHVWSVTVDANRNDGDPTQYDYTKSGVQTACTPSTSPTTTHPSSVPPPSSSPSVPPTTVSVPGPSVSPSTSVAATTVAPSSTTTSIGSASPVAPAPTTPSPSQPEPVVAVGEAPVPHQNPSAVPNHGLQAQEGSELPATGFPVRIVVAAALLLIAIGSVLLLATRRRQWTNRILAAVAEADLDDIDWDDES